MNDLKAALRSLRRTPVSTAVVIVTLAVAIGASTAIFGVVEEVLLRPFGYGDDSRIVVLWGGSGSDGDDQFRLSPADYRDVRDGVEAFGGRVALYRFIGSTITGREQPVRVGSMAATIELFDLLDARPAVGRLFESVDGVPGIDERLVLTYESWQQRFGGDPRIAGKTVELGGEAFTVIGVVEAGFRFPPGADDVEMFTAVRSRASSRGRQRLSSRSPSRWCFWSRRD